MINEQMPFNYNYLVKSFLDTYEEHNKATRSVSKMPSLDADNIEMFQTLTLKDVEDDGLDITEKKSHT
jgi:hypothetical protein